MARTPQEVSWIGPWTGHGLGPYRAWSVPGTLPSDLVGVLTGLLDPVRTAGIPFLAVSTHDTDWLLVRADLSDAAVAAWSAAGIGLVDAEPTS